MSENADLCCFCYVLCRVWLTIKCQHYITTTRHTQQWAKEQYLVIKCVIRHQQLSLLISATHTRLIFRITFHPHHFTFKISRCCCFCHRSRRQQRPPLAFSSYKSENVSFLFTSLALDRYNKVESGTKALVEREKQKNVALCLTKEIALSLTLNSMWFPWLLFLLGTHPFSKSHKVSFIKTKDIFSPLCSPQVNIV